MTICGDADLQSAGIGLPGLAAAFVPSALPAALSVYSDVDGIRIAFISDGRRIKGARLVDSAYFETHDEAVRLEEACRAYLEDAKLPSDAEGWHPFPAAKVAVLLRAARGKVWASVPAVEPPATTPEAAQQVSLCLPERLGRLSRWTLRRAAWFGFLIGLGWSAKRIAADELVRTTPNNVYRLAHRFGLSLSNAAQGQICLDLPHATVVELDRAAALAHLQRDRFIERLLIRAAKDPARFGLVVVSG